MQHRQTPLNDNFLSPAQILFGGLQHPYQLPNSLSNPDTWYPETVKIFLKNFVSQLNKTTFKMLKKEEGEGMAMDIIPDCQFI